MRILLTANGWNMTLAAVLLIAGAMPARAASEADFKAAYAAAEAAEKEAGALRNQWTTTEATLAAAKKIRFRRRFRCRACGGKGGGGAGQSLDLPGDQRERALEGCGHSLEMCEAASQ